MYVCIKQICIYIYIYIFVYMHFLPEDIKRKQGLQPAFALHPRPQRLRSRFLGSTPKLAGPQPSNYPIEKVNSQTPLKGKEPIFKFEFSSPG